MYSWLCLACSVVPQVTILKRPWLHGLIVRTVNDCTYKMVVPLLRFMSVVGLWIACQIFQVSPSQDAEFLDIRCVIESIGV
jgi:hypothetical protein